MRAAALALSALVALSPAASAAGAATLRRPFTPRASGLADAYSPVAGGLSSLGSNPAGLSAAARPRLETTFTSGVSDDTFGFLGWAQPLPRGVAAVGLTYYDAGTVDLRFPGGATQTRTAARDFVGHLAYGLALPGGLSAGAAAKYYRFELAQEARAAGAAFDAGAQWKTPLRGLALGAAVQNAGPGVKFETESDPLPTAVRGGASWSFATAGAKPDSAESYVEGTRFLVTGEALKVRDEAVVAAAGAEIAMDFGPQTSVAVRLGARFNAPSDRITFGFGVTEGRFTLDYALADKRDLGQTHVVGLGVRF